MVEPARQFTATNSTGYRFGFNGKEKSDEINGSGVDYDYGFRIYDCRIGKFLSTDPLTRNYPWYTPYQFAGNKPIWATDVDGLEENTTSTYVYHKPIVLFKPTYKGIITITDASVQGSVHRTFEGNYAKLVKEDKTGLAPAIVNQLVGSNVGSNGILDITAGSLRTQVVKNWKSTDTKYYQQYSYSFISNNITIKGSFEVNIYTNEGTKIYDPLKFVLLNKVINSVIGPTIATAYGKAIQSTTVEALQGSQKVYNGAVLYKLGTTGISSTGAEAQFWSLENPLTMSVEDYAKKYGIPLKNVKNADFLETAVMKPGANYITREAPAAPGSPPGSGGGIEAVVEKGGTTGNVITPLTHR